MMKKWMTIVGLSLGMVFQSGCGTGNEPLDLMATSIPELNEFVVGTSGTNYAGFLVGPYSSAQPYWNFGTNFGSTFSGGGYVAPARGVVSQVGVDGGSNYITLMHSGRLATRFYGLQTITVRPGDSVVQGQAIGAFFLGGNGGFKFQVLLDGAPVCPLSFLSSTFRSRLLFNTVAFVPCQ